MLQQRFETFSFPVHKTFMDPFDTFPTSIYHTVVEKNWKYWTRQFRSFLVTCNQVNGISTHSTVTKLPTNGKSTNVIYWYRLLLLVLMHMLKF